MVETLGWTLIHSLWEIIAVAVLLFTANLFLRGSSANARYAAALLALFCCLAAPLVTFSVLNRQESVPAVAVSLQPSPTVTHASHATLMPALGTVSASEDFRARIAGVLPLVVRIWLGGLCLMLVRLGGGLFSIQRLTRKALPNVDSHWQDCADSLALRLGVRRRVQLRICDSVDTPAVIGMVKAIVLVPAGALIRLSPEHIEALLAHEIAHIRRNDYLVNLLQSIVESVLFYHPLVWWVTSLVRTEREHCCDDLAIRTLGDRASYVQALVQLESHRMALPAFALRASGGSLVARVRRIVASPSRASSPASLWAALALVPVISLGIAHSISSKLQPFTPGHLVGHVLLPDGKPARGAHVYCTSFDVQSMVEPLWQESVTGSSGQFEFNTPASARSTVSAYLDGYAIALEDPNKDATLTLQLGRSGALTVKVVNAAGVPVAHVPVGPATIFSSKGQISKKSFKLLTRKTDEHGLVSISGLPVGSQVILDVDDERFAVGKGAFLIQTVQSAPEKLVLEPACRISGFVSREGRPVQDVLVYPIRVGKGFVAIHSKTDSSGRFDLRRLPKGDYKLQGHLSLDLNRDWVVDPIWVSTVGDSEQRVTLKLSHGGLLLGKVLDAKGKPQSQGSVTLMSDQRPFIGMPVGPVSSDGTFQTRAPAGRYRAVVFGRLGTVEQKLDIKDGQTNRFTLRLPDDSDIVDTHLRVIDADGKPAARVPVSYESHNVGSIAVTDGKGEATISLHKADAESLGSFKVHAGNQFNDLNARPKDGQLTLKLHRVKLASIEGIVVDQAGKPIPSAHVAIGFAGYDKGFLGDLEAVGPGKRLTGRDGRYRYDGIYPGNDAMMMAWADGYAEAQTQDIRVRSEGRNEFPALRLAPGSFVAGRVVDSHGKPAQNSQVILENVTRVSGFVIKTDSDGRFRFDRVPLGRHTLKIFKGYHEERFSAVAGADRVFKLKL